MPQQHDDAKRAADEARDAADEAERSADEASKRADQAEAELDEAEDQAALEDERLFHPGTEGDSGEHQFGVPGDPVSRHSPFYIGFFGGLGVLLAIAVGHAVGHASSVLTLIVVSAFLAVGLNPAV